ncbi:hypothetical protein ACPWON_26045, partial [Pandoraea pneumonica]
MLRSPRGSNVSRQGSAEMAPATPKREALTEDDNMQDDQNVSPDGDAVVEGPAESRYLVPGLERGLRILTQFSPREPV